MVQTIDKAIQKKVTFAEYLTYSHEGKSDVRYELSKGILVEMSAASVTHGRILEYMKAQFDRYLIEQNLPLVAVSEMGVRTEENSSRIPDVVVCSRSSEEALYSRGAGVLDLDESPVLVVEVTSENWRTDYYEKMVEYAAAKIPEYWIIDPNEKRIRLCTDIDQQGSYRYEDFAPGQTVRSRQFPGFELEVAEVLSPPIVQDIIRSEVAALQAATQEAEAERQRAETADQRAEAERQRAEAERQRAEAERQRAEAERQRAEAERQRAEDADQRAEAAIYEAEAERQRAETERQRAEAERQRVAKLEAKLREMGIRVNDL